MVLIIILIAALAGGGYYAYQLNANKDRLISQGQEENQRLNERLAGLTDERNVLKQELTDKVAIIDAFDDQIKGASDIVNQLDKLSRLDEELLRKYSKVSFLSEHYVPSDLRLLDKEYFYDQNKPMQVHAQVRPYLEDLLEAAKRDGIDLRVLSAYRSFGIQTDLKSRYKVLYGQGANQFSADQGYSEHQLGTTVDFTSTELTADPLADFATTEAYDWLVDNAHRYGFVLSYPDDNQYYIFEPWHWRFVGVKLARDLKRNNEYFYDRPQREIDEYLINIFD